MTLPRKRSLPTSFSHEQLSIFSRPRKSWRMMSTPESLTNGVSADLANTAAATDPRQTKLQLRGNEGAKGGWVVQKFGGTSVGKFASNIAEDIVRCVFLWEEKREGGDNWIIDGRMNC